jgi:hypothetical protein
MPSVVLIRDTGIAQSQIRSRNLSRMLLELNRASLTRSTPDRESLAAIGHTGPWLGIGIAGQTYIFNHIADCS